MARRLPPFATLKAFEAAARHCNFTKAAAELGVTPSAVSHQIKQLEEQLGACLFYRSNNALDLTDPARGFLASITQAFDVIEVATSRIERSVGSQTLTINLFPSLAALWLLPGLSSFQAENPSVDVRLMTSLTALDFAGSDIDIAVRYLTEPPAEMPFQFLFEEVVFPVCAPALAAAVADLSMAEALARETLIHCDTQLDEWPLWRAAHGQPDGARSRQIRVDNRLLAIEAARDGLGFVMARTPYADHSLRAGRLVAPFAETVTTGWGYYLVWPERKAKIASLKRFVGWARQHGREVPAAERLPMPVSDAVADRCGRGLQASSRRG